MNPWPIVVADLRRHRLGAVAILLLIAVAVGLGVAVSCAERGLRQGSARAADAFDLVVGAPGSPTQLVLSTVFLEPAPLGLISGEVLAGLQADPAVALVAPIGFGDNYKGFPVVGVTAAFAARLAGQSPIEGANFSRLDEAVLGADVSIAVGEAFAPAHGMVSSGNPQDVHDFLKYRAVGRLPRLGHAWDRAILVPIEAVWWVHGLPLGHAAAAQPHADGTEDHAMEFTGIPIGPPFNVEELPGVPAIVVVPKTVGGAYQLRQRLRQPLRRELSLTAVFPAEVLATLHARLGDVSGLMAATAVLTQALVLGAVLLALLASLAERRRLLGLLRTLGAPRRFVFATAWLTVAALTTAGTALGLLVGWGGAELLAGLVKGRTGLSLPVALTSREFGLALATLLAGFAVALVPAALAYRIDAAAALRG